MATSTEGNAIGRGRESGAGKSSGPRAGKDERRHEPLPSQCAPHSHSTAAVIACLVLAGCAEEYKETRAEWNRAGVACWQKYGQPVIVVRSPTTALCGRGHDVIY